MKTEPEKRWFVTVERVKGRRGIFCSRQGNCVVSDKKLTDSEMMDKLGCFYLILNPKCEQFTEEEILKYSRWVPLPEYKHVWGIAYKKK